MKKIRSNVFETNSSSTHSITMVETEKYNDWINDKCFFIPDSEQFIYISKEKRDSELIEKCKEYEYLTIEDFMKDDPYIIPLSNAEWFDYIVNDNYEDFYAEYKEITAFGYYGNNY